MPRRVALVLGLLVAGAILVVGVVLTRPPRTGASPGALVGQPAPDIAGAPWINSRPLTMAELRGRVVLVEFWTYG